MKTTIIAVANAITAGIRANFEPTDQARELARVGELFLGMAASLETEIGLLGAGVEPGFVPRKTRYADMLGKLGWLLDPRGVPRRVQTKYKVCETYTPQDVGVDRSRRNAEFVSSSADWVELAFLARMACYPGENTADTKHGIRSVLRDSDVAGQLEDQDQKEFEFTIFGTNGEWDLHVVAVPGDGPDSLDRFCVDRRTG